MPVPLTFNLIIDHNSDYFNHLSIQISHDGSAWVSINNIIFSFIMKILTIIIII